MLARFPILKTFAAGVRRLAALAAASATLAVAVSTAAHATVPAAALASQTLTGRFALATGTATTTARLVVTPVASDPLARRFDIAFRHDGEVVRRYDVDMTKLLHLIIVDDELRSFAHVHPTLGANGHFTIGHRFPHAGLYHAYADAEPSGIGQQVFRFDVAVGAAAATTTRVVSEMGATVAAGPYRVALDTTTVRAAHESAVRVRVTKAGALARDLHPYLGALAHAVFLDAATLAYVHVHPQAPGAGDMPGMDMAAMRPLAPDATASPEMLLHVAVARPGTYKLWLQFRGGGGLYVAPFVIRAT